MKCIKKAGLSKQKKKGWYSTWILYRKFLRS